MFDSLQNSTVLINDNDVLGEKVESKQIVDDATNLVHALRKKKHDDSTYMHFLLYNKYLLLNCSEVDTIILVQDSPCTMVI